ncbi:MAG: CotH kinase family protein [Acidimicrobiales bacterium]
MNRARLVAALVTIAIVAGACSSSTDSSSDGSETPAAAPVVGCDAIDRTFVGRERALPHGHIQLDVFAIDESGGSPDAAECVTVRDQATGARVESAVVVRPTERRLSAVVVDPGRTDAERDRAVAIVEALAAADASAEMAVYQWGPVVDPLAQPVFHVDATTDWLVATDTSLAADNWRESRFELTGAFESVAAGTALWPRPDAPTAPIIGRATFDTFELEPASAELTIDHTHGVRVWVNGNEVLTSNLAGATAVADGGPGRHRAAVTVDAATLQSGTNVVAVEMHRTANGDPPEVELTLTGTSPQVVPVSALAPNAAAADLDRAHLDDLAAAVTPPGRIDEVLDVVIDDLESTHDDETDGLRTVVVVAPGQGAPDVDLTGRADALMVWIGSGDEAAKGTDLAFDETRPPEELATELGGHLDAIADSRLVLGICATGVQFEAEVEVGVVNLSTTLKAPPPENVPGPCDPEAAAEAAPAALDEVSLVFDDTSRAAWTQRVADNDKSPFLAQVDLGGGWAPAPAEVSLRGQSSLECDRKSYEVDLETGHRRAVAENAAFDEFFLVSMCLDEGFVRTNTMLQVLADRGLFPPSFRMVRLDIDGSAAGVYLLIEPPNEALRDAQPQLDGVVRRALDTSFQNSTTSWSSIDRDDVVLEAYETTITTAEAGGPDMLDRLRTQMDLDAYLRWLAIMSVTDNGDYVDEVFFAGAGVRDGDIVGQYWTPMGWDPDDIFSPCHFDDFQFVDPSGLSTCAEARLDHAVLSNDEGYAAYVAALDDVLADLGPDEFDAALAATRARLAELIDDEMAAAMPELAVITGRDTSTAESFLDAVDAEIEALRAVFGARHLALTDTVATQSAAAGPTLAPAQLETMAPSRVLAGQSFPVRVVARGTDAIERGWNQEVEVRTDEARPVVMHQGVGVGTGVAPAADQVAVVTEGETVATIEVAGEADRVAPARIDGSVQWGPDEIVRVDEPLVVAPTGSLRIESGTTVVVGAGLNIDIGGTLEATGTVDAPVLFGDQDAAGPWGGLRADGGTIELDHVMLTGGGGDATRAFGHSNSQALLGAVAGGTMSISNSVLADSGAKGFGIENARLDMTSSVIARTDTGGELLDSSFAIDGSWFFDFPTIDAPFADDDNDAIYLGPTTETSTITDTVFVGGLDDGIDHAGADVVIDRVWIEGFVHECLATSEAGSVTITNSVLTGCEQGLEVGYGTPAVRADHLLLLANGVALRYGDDYFVPSQGTFELTDSLLVDNVSGLQTSADPVTLAISGTVSDDVGDEAAGVAIDTPQLNDGLVWEAGGPGGPGLEQPWS